MNFDGKKMRIVRATIAMILLVSAVLGVWAFYNGRRTRTEGSVYVFDGWIYGREDQKRASAALAAAGLSDYSWKDGKLAAPRGKKGEFQSVLANAGAYPKAPSELRAEAVREMSVFESDSKTRFRELNARAMQLERTIEQMRGVEYATVGVCSRNEPSGLRKKTVITASVGVALADGFSLDPNVLASMTVAAKHQLGIDNVADVSIIDLKEGKSYLGVEKVEDPLDVAVAAEKERVEKYWRDKYVEAFSDIKNIRVSVVADLVRSESAGLKPRDDADKSSVASASYVEKVVNDPLERRSGKNLVAAQTQGRFETLDDVEEPVSSKSLGSNRNISDSQAPTNNCNIIPKKNAGVARLGNPSKTASPSQRKNDAPLLAYSENGQGLVPASLRVVKEFSWIDVAGHSSPKFQARYRTKRDDDLKIGCSEESFFLRSMKEGVRDYPFGFDSITADGARTRATCDYKPTSAIRQAVFENPVREGKTDEGAELRGGTILRSIAVLLSVPRSYIRAVDSSRNTDGAQSTFAGAAEDETLKEIKSFAIDLFRPTGERLGWTDEELERWFVVSVYSDLEPRADDVAEGIGNSVEGVEHSSAYFFERDNWSPVSSPDAENAEVLEGEERSDSVAVTEPGGKVSKISKTVASDVETRSSEQNLQPNKSRAVLSPVLVRIQKFLSTQWEPLGRDTVFAFVAAFLCFCAFFVIAKRVLKARSSDQRLVKQHKREKSFAPAVRNVSGKVEDGALTETRRGDFLTSSDDVDDELEGELRKIVAKKQENSSLDSRMVESERIAPSSVFSKDVPSEEYWVKRREALDLIARYPERAAASLQKWAGSELSRDGRRAAS